MESIAETIHALCLHTRLSQSDIARLLGVPPKTLNDWLPNKNREPRTKCRHAQMLALALEALSARLK
jgi:transcriptional regulator with XRE-family HTH domain